MEYEINFLVLQSETENLEKAKDDVKKRIENKGGKITDMLEYKKRKLAYKIRHEQYGFYTVYRFTVEEAADMKKIKRDLNLLQNVARYIIVKADELPTLHEETPESQEMAHRKAKNTVKQEEIEQILSEKKTVSVPKEKVAAKDAVTKNEKADIAAESSRAKEEIKKEELARKIKEEKKPEPEKEDEKKDDERSSLEDLDKKLDEILNG